MFSYKLFAKVLFLNGLGVGVLQTVLLLWSFLLPLEVPLMLLLLILLFLFAAFCVHHQEHLVFAVFFFPRSEEHTSELQSVDFSMTGARWVMPKRVLKELGGWRNLFDQHRSLI